MSSLAALLFVLFAASSVAGMAFIAAPEITTALSPLPRVAMAHPQADGQRVLGDTTSGFYPYPTGTLVNDSGTIYFISGTVKVPFTSWQAFVGLGYSSKNIVEGDLTNYTLSSNYTINTANAEHPWGSWLIYRGTVYYSTQAGLIGVPSVQAFTSNGGDWTYIVKANKYDVAILNANPNLPVLVPNDPRVTSTPNYQFDDNSNNQNGQNFNQNNAALTKPSVSGPSTLAAGTLGTFNFVSASPYGSLNYSINWGDGSALSLGSNLTSGMADTQYHMWATAGIYTIMATVTDASGVSATNTFNISVTSPVANSNSPFVLSQQSFNFTANQGDTIYQQQAMTFVNNTNSNVTYSLSINNQPSWFNGSYNTASSTAYPGTLIGLGAGVNPAGLATGTYTSAIQINGSFSGAPIIIPVTLKIVASANPLTPSLTINSFTLLPATVGQLYNSNAITFNQTGSTNPILVSFTGLPSGIGMPVTSSSGQVVSSTQYSQTQQSYFIGLTGTPTQAGNYNVTLTLNNQSGLTQTQQFFLVVNQAGNIVPSLQITTTSLPNATVGQAYGGTIAFTYNGSKNVNITISGLPAGVQAPTYIGNSGSIGGSEIDFRGAPTTVGTYTVTVSLSDGTITSNTQQFSLVVNPAQGSSSARVGQLVVMQNATVYLVGSSGLYGIPSLDVFNSWGWSFTQVVPANSAEQALSQIGLIPMKQAGCNSPVDQINGTCGTAFNNASLSATLNSAASPLSQFVVGGSTNQPIATFNFVSSAAVTIRQLTFSVSGTGITSVTAGGQTAAVVGNAATIAGLNLSVPAGYTGLAVPVAVSYAQVGINGVASDQTNSLTLDGVQYLSGSTISTYSPSVSSNQMTLVGSYPTLSLASPNTYSGTGPVMLAKVTVNANASGNIVLNQLPISLTSSSALISGTVTVIDEATGQSVNVGATGGPFSGSAAGLNLNFTNDNTIAAGSYKTYDIFMAPSNQSTGYTIYTSLGSAGNFLFNDVNANATNIPGTNIPSYPTNTVSAQVSGGLGSANVSVSPTSLSFSSSNDSNPAAQAVTVSGGGSANSSGINPLIVQVSSNSLNWLGVATTSQANGTALMTIPGNSTIYVSVRVPAGIAVSTVLTGSILINNTNSSFPTVTITIPVTLTISPALANLTVSPTSLSFTAVSGGGNPSAQTLNLSGLSGQWIATTNPNGTWLMVNGGAGGATGVIGSTPFSVSINSSTMSVGSYSGSITIASYDSPPRFASVIVPITLTVQAPSATLSVNSTSFSPTASAPAGWTLGVTSNLPNAVVTICGAKYPAVASSSCSPVSNLGYLATTDAYGNWNASGSFKSGDGTAGTWNEYVVIGQTQSNKITFTVNLPPSY
jgi:hypothetical protein